MFAMTIFGFTLSAIWLVLLVVIWVLIALPPATIAKNKRYNFLGWWCIEDVSCGLG